MIEIVMVLMMMMMMMMETKSIDYYINNIIHKQ